MYYETILVGGVGLKLGGLQVSYELTMEVTNNYIWEPNITLILHSWTFFHASRIRSWTSCQSLLIPFFQCDIVYVQPSIKDCTFDFMYLTKVHNLCGCEWVQMN